jgi:indole-3-glycerol phosphate synthase
MGINNENHAKFSKRSNNTENLNQTATKEIAVFEEGGVRGPNLRIANEYLKNVRRTSVESVREISD